MLKRTLPLLLALLLLLCGCGKTEAPTEPPTTAPTTEAPTTAPTTEAPTTAPTTEPTEAARMYRNPLNGQWLEAPHTGRATGVMFNNIEFAMPLCGITEADIVFEALADCCNATRMEGIFSDISQAPRLGSIRSSRPYFVSICRAFDALYVHFGGSAEALDLLASLGYDRMDGLVYDGVYYYRDQDRLNSGYALEHTAFTTGEAIAQFTRDKGISMDREEEVSYGLTFDDDKLTGGSPATDFTVYFGDYGKSTGFVYDEETGLYGASQFGGPILDGNNDQQLSFRNLILLHCPVYPQPDMYRMTMELVGEGRADLVRDGQVVSICWSRESEDSPFVFTYEDGTPASLGVGHTYVAILPLDAEFDIQ